MEMENSGQSGKKGRMQGAKRRFVTHLATCGNISESARVAKIESGTLYRWRSQDMEFAEAWERALEAAVDAMEAEARRRAVQGYDEPVFYGGRIVQDPDTGKPIMRRKYSDGLMRFLLRAHRPARFGETDREGKTGMISINITADDSVL